MFAAYITGKCSYKWVTNVHYDNVSIFFLVLREVSYNKGIIYTSWKFIKPRFACLACSCAWLCVP